jgi:hypothetical protein
MSIASQLIISLTNIVDLTDDLLDYSWESESDESEDLTNPQYHSPMTSDASSEWSEPESEY